MSQVYRIVEDDWNVRTGCTLVGRVNAWLVGRDELGAANARPRLMTEGIMPHIIVHAIMSVLSRSCRVGEGAGVGRGTHPAKQEDRVVAGRPACRRVAWRWGSRIK